MQDSFARSGRIELPTVTDTHDFAAQLGAALEPGDVVILDGPLGAGKTTFTQGLARGMQVKGRVTSPTFVIAREHRSLCGGPALVHVDAYRLIDESGSGDPFGELDALDLDTDLDKAVVVAEWGRGLAEELSDTYLAVTIDREAEDASSEDARVITWNWVG
ncbi:MAG: tRNA (adenosine(37)-N6)-threonylcarbamoyltransferase complex ATPase subunit type 1 TsaE [Corynebacterium camporealensis]|uniref:tRNA (adenosine(37)-N6)-threonylcarbamoyltransferase complex ATPase subunit type 1 TsaE n=1 Tax=Corynebacterium camporealensis TaxID=161896 RepID=UPI002A9090D0|nr:tRNA (adenosine(37)-N6)-threonylcarbamoyltransferase complex ATPase subunit type 1 TsaE [Corynebacterium camporealensis]MDY5840403.1 tRNA (adenosine(37)-N6)-threonylcarbamoyltransferase complex ATPase subunit type 1 TsaE [Corynebacterium camporealensis]